MAVNAKPDYFSRIARLRIIHLLRIPDTTNLGFRVVSPDGKIINDTNGSTPADVAMPSRLHLENVTIGYGSDPVVFDVSLEIKPANLTVLIGPNGCGKSTLLKAMARILPLETGQITLDRKPLHKIPTREVARRLAMLPQGPIAPEGLTVRELVAQGRFPHQTLLKQWSVADSQAVASAMAATNIEEFADRAISSLSGGQRQRCWIAMVLAQETPIILLDEPTTFLDLKVQVDVMKLLRQIASQGRSLIVVLHELNIASAFADQLIMMREGRIIARGTPHEIMIPERLAEVFDLDAQIIPDPETGRPICVPRIDGAKR